VIVINKGTIAEQGTHDELLQMNGVYKRLVLRQLDNDFSVGNDDGSEKSKNDDSKPPGLMRQLSDNLVWLIDHDK